MGSGPPNSKPGAGEWPKVCALLSAPLPVLTSQLVAAEAGAADAAAQRGAAAAAGAPGGSAAGGGGSGCGGAGTGGGGGSGAGGSAGLGSATRPAAAAEVEAPLQRLLLEGMSIGLVADAASIDTLLK